MQNVSASASTPKRRYYAKKKAKVSNQPEAASDIGQDRIPTVTPSLEIQPNATPSSEFDGLPINQTLKTALKQDCGYLKMTPVQSQTITPLLQNLDVHIKAKTGSGKTMAFLVPSVQKIVTLKQQRVGPSVLVVSPTRELAMQIAKECQLLTKRLPSIKTAIVIGGTNINTEKKTLDAGVQVLIATPGRLLDHLSSQPNLLQGVDTFVLDECDRLLDMGFAPDINKIIGYLPDSNQRQSILCSATTSPTINKIIKAMLKSNYVFVSTETQGEALTHEKVPQFSVVASFVEQLEITIDLLEYSLRNDSSRTFKAIVFLPTAHLANLYHAVQSQTRLCSNIFVQHSRQSQSARIKVSKQFMDCTQGVLFATDVVARGMDFPLVSHVYQVGVPDSVETYVHRLGRTGRADASGQGIIILAQQELFFLDSLIVNKKIPIKPLQKEKISQEMSMFVRDGVRNFCSEEKIALQVYQSWLGFYNGRTKNMNMDKAGLVREANSFAKAVLGCDLPPAMEKKTVGKMGLKGVAGIRYQ